MKTKLKTTLALFAAICGLHAFASIVPLATWNGDLANNSTKNGFTMTFGSNAAASSGSAVLTAKTSGSGNTGVAIDWSNATFSGQTMTVLVKYSGFSHSSCSGHTAILGTYWGSSNKSTEILFNARRESNTDRIKLASGVTSSSSGSNGTYWSKSIPEAGLMRVTYSSSGTHYTFLTGSDGSWTSSADATTTDAAFKKSESFYGLKIGGSIASMGSYYRPGMTVSAVTILDTDITDAELTAFNFSTVTTDFLAKGKNANSPTGWFTSWGGETFGNESQAVGPGSYGQVYVGNNGSNHPYRSYKLPESFTIAMYCDATSGVASDASKYAIYWSAGNSGGVSAVLCRKGDKIYFHANGGNTSTSLDLPSSGGYHLYTATYTTTGISLTCDADTAHTATASATLSQANNGFQVCGVFQGAPSAYDRPVALPIAAIIGFSKVLTTPEIVALSNDFYPAATAGSFNDILTLDNGTMTIPAGFSASAKSVRFGNNNSSSAATLNLGGVLNVTGASTKSGTGSGGIRDDVLNKRGGILLGEWTGVGTYNITGTLNASVNYLQLRNDAGAQTMNIDGGTVSVKGLTTKSGNTSTINLTNGGTLEIAEIVSDAGTITRNYNDGTVRALGDINETQAITLGGTGAGTTFDANGHTFTLSCTLSGTGKASIANSGSGGKVVVPENRFPGELTVAEGATLDITSTETKDSYTITAGAFANHGTVQLNGTPLSQTDYSIVGNKIVRPKKATINTSTTWANLWGENPPAETDSVELTVETTATLTIGSETTVVAIKVTSAADNKLTLAGAQYLTATTYDFSAAAGKVTFDCTGLTGCTTLLSGAVSGTENIDTTGVNVPDGYQIYADATGVYLTRKDYLKFINNPAVLTYNGAASFHSAYYNLFSIMTGADTGTSYNGNGSSVTVIPGQTEVLSKSWFIFSTGQKYVAPGYVLRLDPNVGTQGSAMDAQFNPLTLGGMMVESGATGFSFTSSAGSGYGRNTELGDNRTTGGTDTWFIFKESFVFSRTAGELQLKLFGAVNFDIAAEKTVNLNKSVSACSPTLDTGTHAQLKMHGEGQILVNTLTATGDVTLDYSDLGSRVNTNPYIDGTVAIDASTKIKLPAGLTAGTAFKMATTVSGGTDGKRTIYLGDTAVEKFVSFANGAITWYETAYAAEVSANGKWSELNWNPARPTAGFPAGADFTLTNSGSADVTTVNVDDTVTANKLTIVSATKVLKFGSPSHLTVTTYDFSQAPGGVGFGVTGGWTIPDALATYLRQNNVKAIFYTDDSTGATLDYGTAQNNYTFSGHYVFVGGTHTFQNCSESAGLLFGANATAENPTLWVKDNTTLNFKSRNPCGWNSSGGTGGIIRMGNGATVSAQNSASGTWYWSQQFYFDPGSTLNIVTEGFRVVGSDEKAKAQFYMPESSGGTATISSANATTYLQIGDNSYSKMAVDVGQGSTLEITAPLKTRSDGKNFKKYGLGTLKLSGGLVDFMPTASVEGGVLEIATETDFKSGTTMAVANGATLKFGAVSGTFASVISGAGALVKDGSGTTTTLTGANTYSGGTTVTAGTLKVAEGASIGTGNYSVAAGAELKLPSTFRPSDAKLIGTSAGTVGITLTSLEFTDFEAGTQVALIGIDGSSFAGTVKIYDLDGGEHLNTATVKDGKICVTKIDQKRSPFHVTNPASGNWTAAAWKDSSDPAKDVEADDWELTVSANLAVEAENTSALTVNRLIKLGTFNVTNAGALTVTATDYALTADTLAPVNTGNLTLSGNITVTGAIDDSANTGTTTLDFPTHAAAITAGANTIVRGGGTGALTIGAGKTATITNGVWAGTIPSPTATSTLKFAGTTQLATVPYTAANSFAGTVVYAAPFAEVTGSDGVQFAGSMTRKFDAGLSLTTTRFVTGNNGGAVQNFTQDGGSITVTGSNPPTSNQASAFFAHYNSTVSYTMNGGTFTAVNAAMRLGWDGNCNFTNANGTIHVKGIKSGGDGHSGKGHFTMTGGTLEIGDFGIQGVGDTSAYTFSGGTIRAYADTSIAIAHADGMKVTGPITIDPNGHTVTISAKLTGSGDITVNDSSVGANGVVKFTGDKASYTGTITFENGTFDIGTARAKPTSGYVFGSGVKFAATQTRLEYAQALVSTFTDFTQGQTITLNKLDGTSATMTVPEGGTVTFPAGSVHIDGPATLYDITFTNLNDVGKTTGTISYKAVSAGTLQYDNEATFYTTDPDVVKERGVHIRHHPYLSGAASALNPLTDFTAVFVGEMSKTDNRIFVHFGSSSGTNKGIMIATMEGTDAVGVFSNVGSTLTQLTKLSVPNSATARHVYIVTKQEIDGNTVFTIYLDGVQRAKTTIEGSFVLGTSDHCGVQVGADYGGQIRTGTYKDVDKTDPNEKGFLSVCRIYDYMLTPAQVGEITKQYPYNPKGGNYLRTVTGTVDYVAEGTWTTNTSVAAEFAAPTGLSGFLPSAELTADGAATVTVNTNSTIDTFKFYGSAMTFVKDATGTNSIAIGTAIIDTVVTNKYGALDFSKAAVSLTSGSLTFDMRDFPLTNYFADAHIQMTGMTSQDAIITMINMPTTPGRTTSFAFDPSDDAYYLTITVTPAPFVYTIAEGGEGAWTWHDAPVSEGQVAAQTTGEIQKKGDGTAELPPMALPYNILAGTLKFMSAPTAPCSITNVAANATFDLNGIENTEVANNFVVTLNGGTLTNSGDNRGILKSLTLLANSYVDVGENKVIWIQNAKEGYANTTLALGTFTLTKNGLGEFGVVSTTVSGTGIIDVEGGKLWMQESSNFADSTIKVGAAGKFHVRSDRACTAHNIEGVEGGTIEVGASGITSFNLSGTLTFVEGGTYGTITNQAGAVAKVGNRRNLTFAGAGTVDVTMQDSEAIGDKETTAFTLADSASTTVGTITYDGVDVTSKCTVANNTFTVKLAECVAKDATHSYLTLPAAIRNATEGSTITALADIATGDGIAVDKNITLDGAGCELTGTGFTGAGTLTIIGGRIGVDGLPTAYALQGGEYPAAKVTGEGAWTVASGYHLVDIYSTEALTYSKQIAIGSSPAAEDEKSYPVTPKGGSEVVGAIVVKTSDLVEKGIVSEGATPAQVSAALAADGANHYPTWQNVVLGLDNNVETSIPYPAPVQGTSTTQVSLKLGSNVSVDTTTGAKVTYKVMTKGATGSYEYEQGEWSYDATATLDLPTTQEGVKYYKFDVIVTPAK